jgi:hypothetical protein
LIVGVRKLGFFSWRRRRGGVRVNGDEIKVPRWWWWWWWRSRRIGLVL